MREKLRSPGKRVCTVHCVSFKMHCMLASSTPCKLSLCADRAHGCAGDSYTSSGIDVASPTTQRVLAIASLHELHGDSWPSSSTGTSSFCCNQQYSITAVTTSAGAIAERYAYSAYGEPTILDGSGAALQTSNFNIRHSFTGREWDAMVGLHHFRARWMSPKTGRFMCRDPIGYEGSPYDLYEYCESNPIRFLDPFGYGICGLPDDLNLNDEEALKNFMKNLSPAELRRIRDCLKRQRPDIWRKWVKAEKYGDNRNKDNRRNNKGKGKPKKGIITRCGLKYLFLAECEFLCAYGYSLCLDSASVGQEDCGDRCRGLPFSEQQDCIDNCFYIWTLDAAECGIIYTACGLACLTPIPED